MRRGHGSRVVPGAEPDLPRPPLERPDPEGPEREGRGYRPGPSPQGSRPGRACAAGFAARPVSGRGASVGRAGPGGEWPDRLRPRSAAASRAPSRAGPGGRPPSRCGGGGGAGRASAGRACERCPLLIEPGAAQGYRWPRLGPPPAAARGRECA